MNVDILENISIIKSMEKVKQLTFNDYRMTTGEHGGPRPGAGGERNEGGRRALTTPREVRNALAYVLLNVRKHYQEREGFPPPVRFDAASSGRWFDGWLPEEPIFCPEEFPGPDLREVAPAQTWLLKKGWKQCGLIDPAEVPGGRKRRAA